MTALLTSRPVREATALARTTPGVLTGLALVLVAAALLAGLFTSLSVQRRGESVADLATRSGPLTAAAQEIYRSLSDADATATGAFLSGGLEPAASRQRYEADVAQAANALTIAVAAREPADVAAPDSPLATLTGQLPVYTGLVETARADNRQGLPLGAAYQREASNLMRTRLLPAAERLYRSESADLSADQDSASGVPWVEILLSLAVLALLVLAQVFLRRRTNRVFNAGLLAATAAAVVSLLWVLVATVSAVKDVGDSRDEGSAQIDVLVRARIATLNARADETLTLVARGAGSAYQDDYVQVTGQLAALLEQARSLATDPEVGNRVATAAADAKAWTLAHTGIRAADDTGDYVLAVQRATDTGPAGAAGLFDRLDRDLQTAIDHTRATFGEEVTDASRALAGTLAAVTVLAVVTAAGAAAGIWRRLKDYR
ncbi:hypothetical protein FHX82_003740 [Amycolatopsis bartoniae]|uniref:Secreted protein n=1 Tax=Amycolatopsis bartoniae TaxID=941986 RepID=A0A8H9MD40_9PSEU|nr:hypothetical protein [Amycolatopsis bartoniae]MBB2936676.1 hypothetical protein [Amycolatopsis bartoniae]TVT09746.1 hypothetical protein FNH07_07340 [Amycolatopsis bartoniae]GHF67183.1 hypothetical protein GCM10017566_46120 [Amycolatopsis bartoniae]